MTEPDRSRLPWRQVFEDGLPIGQARCWSEVEELLIDRGATAAEARAAATTRNVEGPDGFHIIAPGDIDDMMARVRQAQGRGAAR